MNNNALGPLPMFPGPYPGESFYSVLCRYHVRSCNKNSRYTMQQLFGAKRNIGTTLLTPFRLYEVGRWAADGSPITPEEMLMSNTAFPLIMTTMFDQYILENATIAVTVKKRGDAPGLSNRSICRYNRVLMAPPYVLRYCPECARMQKRQYGEPYWQILPQVKGVEFCPKHKCRIMSTSITIDDINWRFYPASEIINNSYNTGYPQNEWTDLVKRNRRFFISMAEGIEWIFDNPQYTGGLKKLCRCYCSARDLRHAWWSYIRPYYKLEEVLRCFPSRELGTYAIKENNKYRQQGLYYLHREELKIYKMPFYLHVMNMMLISGSPQSFYYSSHKAE